jgi:hypothetical protein
MNVFSMACSIEICETIRIGICRYRRIETGHGERINCGVLRNTELMSSGSGDPWENNLIGFADQHSVISFFSLFVYHPGTIHSYRQHHSEICL